MGRSGTEPLEKVSDLIDTYTGKWKVDLIRRNFFAPDAAAILNIPLRAAGGEDLLAWALDKTGNYTVKSAYRTLTTRNEHAALEEGTIMGTSSTNEQLWKALWSLKVVSKVQVFWWRVLRGILPDSMTLKHRHIKQIGRCDVCLAKNEDLQHALLTCSHAKKFWDAALERFDIKMPALHPHTWAADILMDERFKSDERCRIITIMYYVWSSRNRWTHDREVFDPVQAVKWVHEMLALLELPKRKSTLAGGQCWRPPDAGWVKINTDAAISAPFSTGGAGGVARSHVAFLGAWCKPLDGVTDPMIAETLAVREGVLFARLRGYSHVVVESDCLEVVNLCTLRGNSRSIASPIIQEIGELAGTFVSFSIRHVGRVLNVPAHLCAKRASTLAGTESWLGESPDFLVPSLLDDCTRMLTK